MVHSYNREAETHLDVLGLEIGERETTAGSYRVITSTAEANVVVRRTSK